MKKLSLRSVELNTAILLSNEEKKKVLGGRIFEGENGCGTCKIGLICSCGQCVDPSYKYYCKDGY